MKAKAAWHREKGEYEARLARLKELEAGVPAMNDELEQLECEAAEADRTGGDVDLSRIEAQRSRCNVRARSIESQRAKVAEAKSAYEAAVRSAEAQAKRAIEAEAAEQGAVARELIAKLAEVLDGIPAMQARYPSTGDEHIATHYAIPNLRKFVDAIAGSEA